MADEGGVIDLCDSDEEERRYTEEMEALGWAAPTPTPSGAAAAASAGGSGGEGKENIQQQLQPPQQQPVRPTTASSSTSSASASASSGSSYRPSQDSEDGGGGKGSKPKPKPAKATTKAAAADEDSSSVEDPEDKKEELSDEQRGILRHVMSGKNCYYSGKAGCGKSHLLRAIIARAPAGKTFVTASTGIAAISIGGTTLHSFAGVGLGEESVEVLKERANRPKSRQNWSACEVLIIDEISMLHGSLLAKLNAIAQHVKGSSKPFGGIQLICTGDFFQLPPVSKKRGSGGQEPQHDYCFLHPVWRELFPDGCTFELTRIFRQAEQRLVALLNDVRKGQLSQPSHALLRELARPLRPPAGIEPTLLFPTNERVDAVNAQRLAQLPGAEWVYDADDAGSEPHLSQMRKNCLAEARLKLKEGAQVMLIKNLNVGAGLCNGSKGVVIGFTPPDEDAPPGSSAGRQGWPMVRFANGVEQAIMSEEWSIETTERRATVKKASRVQIPLKLGWAITIHKSQGMGLPYMVADLASIFEDGQGYVALSRSISLDGLQVASFRPERFRTSPAVVSFYEQHVQGKTQPEGRPEEEWGDVSGNWEPEHPKYAEQKRRDEARAVKAAERRALRAGNGEDGAGSSDEEGGWGRKGGGGGVGGGWQGKRDGPYSSWNSNAARGGGAGGGGGGGFKRGRYGGYDAGEWLPRLSLQKSAAPPPPHAPPPAPAAPPVYRPNYVAGGGAAAAAAAAGAGAGAAAAAAAPSGGRCWPVQPYVPARYRPGGPGAAAGAGGQPPAQPQQQLQQPRPAFAPASSVRANLKAADGGGATGQKGQGQNQGQGQRGGGNKGSAWAAYDSRKTVPIYNKKGGGGKGGQASIANWFRK